MRYGTPFAEESHSATYNCAQSSQGFPGNPRDVLAYRLRRGEASQALHTCSINGAIVSQRQHGACSSRRCTSSQSRPQTRKETHDERDDKKPPMLLNDGAYEDMEDMAELIKPSAGGG